MLNNPTLSQPLAAPILLFFLLLLLLLIIITIITIIIIITIIVIIVIIIITIIIIIIVIVIIIFSFIHKYCPFNDTFLSAKLSFKLHMHYFCQSSYKLYIFTDHCLTFTWVER